MPSRRNNRKKGRKQNAKNFGNPMHAATNACSEAASDGVLELQASRMIEDLVGNPCPIDDAKQKMNKLTEMSGTDLSLNEADPFGNGDQSGCGQMGSAGEPTRQILRSLFAEGADLNSYLIYRGFSPFALACATGNASAVEHFLKEETKFGSQERMQMLERRETGMRHSPLSLTLALYKAKYNVSVIYSIPESQMDHLGVFKLLLKYGAAPDCKDLTGKTIVHYGAGAQAKPITQDMAAFCIDAAKSSAHIGKDVILRNLSADKYNGMEGKLGGYLADSGRREVVLDNGTSLSLQPANIFLKDGDSEKCILDEKRNLVNEPDRLGSISLHEVFMSERLDIAKFLTEEHKADIDIEDRGEMSVRKLAYISMSFASEMSLLIRKYGTMQDKKCTMCNKVSQKLKVCSRCKKVGYCSVECQKKDWTSHKKECKPVAQKIVKLMKPEKEKVFSFNGASQNYGRPNGVEVNEKFFIKIQSNGVPTVPHMVYDKSRTCNFYINPTDPAYREIAEKVKAETSYMGLKMYVKASFGSVGNCTVYLDETFLKNW